MQVRNNRYTSDELSQFKCPCCPTTFALEDLRDPLSVKEHGISGMCQKCQDSVFGAFPEPTYASSPVALNAAISAASKAGFEVIQSDAHTLLCDLDTEHAVEQFHRVYPIVEQHFAAQRFEMWKSKSGNTHARVFLGLAIHDPADRYLLQAALGSDGKREALSLVQLIADCIEPSVLFKPRSE
jgi:hypothetical protein